MATIQQITDWFKERGSTVILSDNNLDQVIVAPRSIDAASIDDLTFLNRKFENQFIELITHSTCQLIILDASLVKNTQLDNLPKNKSYILSANPKEDVIAYCKAFLDFEKELEEISIHSSSSIDNNVVIKDFVKIAANVVIEENVVIGANCRIGANTLISKNTIIGDNVEIGSNNVIGGVGFGYAQNEITKAYEQFPHYGKVIIHNNVSIGNNTCIDKGSLSDTIIHEGVKIDNLVHIAHNVKIGKNSLIIAKAMIAGSVVIGENCWIAPSSSIRNGISIGDNVTVGLASTVTRSVESGSVVMGSPAVPLDDFKKIRQHQTEILKK